MSHPIFRLFLLLFFYELFSAIIYICLLTSLPPAGSGAQPGSSSGSWEQHPTDSSYGFSPNNPRHSPNVSSSRVGTPNPSHGSALGPSSSGNLAASMQNLNSHDSTGAQGALNSSSVNTSPFLHPGAGQRTRRKSDTALEPPTWDTFIPGGQAQHRHSQQQRDAMEGSAVDDGMGELNMGYGAGHGQPQPGQPQHHLQHQQGYNTLPQQQQQQQSQSGHPPTLGHNFSFGPPASQQPSMSNNFLSPDISNHLRRAKSDSVNRGHRQSRSEDVRSPANMGGIGNNPSASGGYLFPPSSHGESYGLGLNFQAPHQTPPPGAFLSVSDPMPSIRHGHYRRASSGTRSERGSPASRDWLTGPVGDGIIGGGEGGRGAWSGASSTRVSPYPSPNASPRPRYDDLPAPNSMNVGLGAPGALSLMANVTDVEGQPIVISKPNVTTGRTANASHRRRKQEATFVCPIPGCGSTFTRSFNLKGALFSRLRLVSGMTNRTTFSLYPLPSLRQVTYALTKRRSHSSAIGLDVERASQGSMTASVMNNCIPIIDLSLAKAATNSLQGWTH